MFMNNLFDILIFERVTTIVVAAASTARLLN